MKPIRFGFDGSVWGRLIGVAIYAVAAFGSILWIESTSASPLESPLEQQPVAKTESLSLRLDSTVNVHSWTVRLNGEDITADNTTARQWRAEIPFSPDLHNELFIEAQTGEYFSEADDALRARIKATGMVIDRTWWGSGIIAVLVDLDEVMPQ